MISITLPRTSIIIKTSPMQHPRCRYRHNMGVRLERVKVIIPAAKKRQSTDDSMNPEMKIVKSCKLGVSEVKAAMVPPRAAQ